MPKFFFRKKFVLYFIFFAVFLFVQSCFIGLVSFIYQNIFYIENFIGYDSHKYIIDNLPHVLFFNGIFIFGKLVSNALKSQGIIDKLEKEKVVSELKALKSQINPHFLFNTLNTIYGMSLSKNEKTPEAILSLSEIFKYVLYESETERVNLEIELNYIKQYIELIKLRKKKNSNIRLKIEGETENRKIAPLILIPFIENAIKHGLNSAVDETWLDISIQINGNNLLFICKNNYREEKFKDNHNGIGLENVTKRLNIIYHNKFTIVITKINFVYEVTLKLEIE
jgi:LytS/YehU family sensor histidine kinase